ncbi:hypothetical protein AUI06_09025 [archaeon 13_2_20CM_2_52_21]|nr:MAG: hypothetical protein AUI06_09025 [archaeon 13_2_20CM_2_52_21]
MSQFPEKSVDLVYADPPFFSNRKYEVIWGDGYEVRAFEDRWKGGIENYTAWMEPKVRECYRVLKDSGSMYLHCDWHANGHLRVLMDHVFGEGNIVNEIVWQRTVNPKGSQFEERKFGQATDTILFYAKSSDYVFNLKAVKRKLTSEELHEKYDRVDEKGRYYPGPVICGPSMGPRPNLVYEYKSFTPGPSGWRLSREKLVQLDIVGNLGWSRNGKPFRKLRPQDDEGDPMYNLWTDIPRVSSASNERLGYPTQKPVGLLDRIVRASSNPMDIVLDPFCGCGTAIAVAQKPEGDGWE